MKEGKVSIAAGGSESVLRGLFAGYSDDSDDEDDGGGGGGGGGGGEAVVSLREQALGRSGGGGGGGGGAADAAGPAGRTPGVKRKAEGDPRWGDAG
jgi:hypothetical protein